jgi:drug/metabolite transporter (DMT)-like permease
MRPGHGAGIACMVAGTSVFAAMDALVKALMADYPVVQVLFFRSVFALVPLAPLLWHEGRGALATGRPWAHVLRSGIGMVAIACFFVAFGALPLAQVTIIAFAAPLLVTALSVPVLKEKVGRRRWAAVSAGFVGVLVIVRPADMAGFDIGLAAALLGTVLYAVVMVLIRAMSATERPVTIVGWFTLSSIAASGIALPWFWVQPIGWDWAGLAAIGIFGGIAQLLITQAVRLAPVSVVMPFDYLHLIFAITLGWAFWGEIPGPRTWVGGAIIVAAGLYVLHRETRA